MASNAGRSTLNLLLQELQSVLPKALDVCGGGGGGSAAAANGGGASASANGGDDVVLSRLRSVLFALLRSCLSTRPGARLRRLRVYVSSCVALGAASGAGVLPLTSCSGDRFKKAARGARCCAPRAAAVLRALRAVGAVVADSSPPLTLLPIHAHTLRVHACTMHHHTPRQAVKQKETYSVLRVATVVLERLPSVFAGGAAGAVLAKLLQLLAEPSAYASA